MNIILNMYIEYLLYSVQEWTNQKQIHVPSSVSTSLTGSRTIIWMVIGMIARIWTSCITLQLYACHPDSPMCVCVCKYTYTYINITQTDPWHDSQHKYMFQDFWLSTEWIIGATQTFMCIYVWYRYKDIHIVYLRDCAKAKW